METYASLLRMYYGFFHPLEKQIQELLSSDDLADIRLRRNSRLLIEDLSALPVAFAYPAICYQLPVLQTKAQAFGALYVAEGSSLGGRVIAKMLLKNPGLSISHRQLNYFNGYGDQTGIRWTELLQVLNAQEEAGPIVEAANDTFLQFENWIKASLAHD
jgi:heme oxygenase